MRRWIFAFVALVVVASVSTARGGFTIVFDYSTDTSSFFGVGSTARSTLEAGASFFETNLADDFTAITPGGINTWTARFTHPTTGVLDTSNVDLTIAADTIRVFVGARDLGGTTLGSAGPGGFSAGGTQAFFDNLFARGEGGGVQADVDGGTATEFALWGGSLAVDSDSTWNLDHTASPTSGENDLFSVVLHELGHVLGIGIADSWDNLVNGSNEFTGTNSVLEFGGNIALQSGGNHWANGTTSNVFPNGLSQEAAMSPSITTGTRKVFTDLDMAGLDDIGWEIQSTAVPEPSQFLLTILVAVAAGFWRWRRCRWVNLLCAVKADGFPRRPSDRPRVRPAQKTQSNASFTLFECPLQNELDFATGPPDE